MSDLRRSSLFIFPRQYGRSKTSSGFPQDEANSHPPTTPISQPYLRYLEVIYVCNFPSSPPLYQHLHHPLNPPLLYPSSLPKTFSSTQNFHFAKPQLIQPSLISCTETSLHKVHPTSKHKEQTQYHLFYDYHAITCF